MKRYYNTKTGNEHIHSKGNTLPLGVIELPKDHAFLKENSRNPDAQCEWGYDFKMVKGELLRVPIGAPVVTEKDKAAKVDAVESAWIKEQMVRASEEIELHKDVCPTKCGQEKDWREYRNALRAWPKDSKYGDVNFRPKVVLTNIHGHIID